MSAQEPTNRPTDPNERAAAIVREATADPPPTRDEVREAIRALERRLHPDVEALADLATIRDWFEAAPDAEKSAAAIGRKGGLRGGKARAEKLSKAERAEIARKAATARWEKSRPT